MTNMKFDCGGTSLCSCSSFNARADFCALASLTICVLLLLLDRFHVLFALPFCSINVGAAAVLGAAQAIAAVEPPGVEVHFVIAATDNMVNERGIVPGDILVASNGKTIEIGNTDAEGRLTMADALVYADQTLKCSQILELSTLTGACMMALGTAMAGLFTRDAVMAETLAAVGEACGNKVWRLPMAAEYEEEIVSKMADLKNIGGRFGGAITAALFLQHFVQDGTSFGHVDMAGPVWDYKASQASGWGARLVTGWVLHQSSQQLDEYMHRRSPDLFTPTELPR